MGNTHKQGQKTNQHDYFGKTSTFQENGQKYHVVGYPIKEQQDTKNFIDELNTIQGFLNKHLLLHSKYTTEKAGLCGTSHILNLTFPFYPHSLQKEIQNRKKEGDHLSQVELTNLIYQIMEGTKIFDQLDIKFGDIRPSKILLDQEHSSIKLINHFTSPNQSTGLQKSFQYKQKTYLSPQQLKSLEMKNIKPQINIHKADSFSLGLTVLAVGNLIRIQDSLYDYNGFFFSHKALNSQVNAFQKRYGTFLTSIVKVLVQKQPRNRLYISEIAALLYVYEKQIYSFMIFQPDYDLMLQNYQNKYVGVKSEHFKTWFNEWKSQNLVIKSQIKNNYVGSPHVRFTYSSPTQNKSLIRNQQQLNK